MQKLNDLSDPSLASIRTALIAVIEMSQSSWLVAGIVPGVERQPLKLAVDRRIAESAQSLAYGSGKQDARLSALLLPSRPAGRFSGWHAGSGHAASRPTYHV